MEPVPHPPEGVVEAARQRTFCEVPKNLQVLPLAVLVQLIHVLIVADGGDIATGLRSVVLLYIRDLIPILNIYHGYSPFDSVNP